MAGSPTECQRWSELTARRYDDEIDQEGIGFGGLHSGVFGSRSNLGRSRRKGKIPIEVVPRYDS